VDPQTRTYGPVVEGVASVIIIWRFSGARVFSQRAEQHAQRLVAIQFFLLAPYVAYESIRALLGGEHPDVSWIGLTVGSVIFMPMFGIAKERLADQMGSALVPAELLDSRVLMVVGHSHPNGLKMRSHLMSKRLVGGIGLPTGDDDDSVVRLAGRIERRPVVGVVLRLDP
jgi:hypothetical protein